MLFMFRKFSTQSGLTDLQHASLEDKVWFDCREFTWHCLRFYILVSLCLLSCLSSYESRKPTSTPFHVLPTGETFFDVEAVICLAIIYFFLWAKKQWAIIFGLEISLFPNFSTKLITQARHCNALDHFSNQVSQPRQGPVNYLRNLDLADNSVLQVLHRIQAFDDWSSIV